MPQRIQTSPQGLLSYLDLNLGDSPKSVEDPLRITVDGSAMYFMQKREAISANVAAAGVPGNAASITMPQREVWAVFNIGMSGNAPTAIGVVMEAEITYRLRQSNAAVTHSLGMSKLVTSIGVTDRLAFGVQFEKPMLFPGGSRFFALVTTPAVAAGTWSMTLQLDFARLSI